MGAQGFRSCVVLNPNSAGGRTGRRLESIRAAIKRTLPRAEIRCTDYAGHATLLTREALGQGFEMIVAGGGDGTINEVTNGFFESGEATHPEAVLGILPQGTGGDFRKCIGLDAGRGLRALGGQAQFEAALARLAGRETRRIDVGWAEFCDHGGAPASRAFLNIASFGVSGAVDAEVNRASKRLGGKLSFMIGSLRALSHFEDQPVRLSLDGAPERSLSITTVAVCNGQYFGGGMWVAPKAELDDGRFDLTIWSGYRLKDFVLNGRMIYHGTHLSDPRTESQRCRCLEAGVDPGQSVLLDLDGEQPGRLPASFRILESALSLKCAPEAR